jgi:DNA topoisomerase I
MARFAGGPGEAGRTVRWGMMPETPAEELRFCTDEEPGVRRVRRGDDFKYVAPDGRLVRDPKTLSRITALAIPPAWEDVWICPHPHGHLQAVGRDARRRKQYRYHPLWSRRRSALKYDRMLRFARALPQLKSRVREDLAKSGLPREKVLATVVALLERTLIRIGNPEYARNNESFGLTTLRDEHADVSGSRLRLRFRGKGGTPVHVDLRDPVLARIVKRCRALPGQELFRYVDDEGELRKVGSGDVNEYLREATGEDLTAKDFRTWGATVLAAALLRQQPPPPSLKQADAVIRRVIQEVSTHLRNTPATCRQYYVHPVVLEAYREHTLDRLSPEPPENVSPVDPEAEDLALRALIQAYSPRSRRTSPRRGLHSPKLASRGSEPARTGA